MGLTLVTAATSYPVTLAEVKTYLGIDTTDFDDRINLALPGCTREIERYTQRAFKSQTWKLTLDDFYDEIELPRGPVTAITAFTYLDADDASQTVSSTLYTLDVTSEPQRIVLNSGESWPEVSDLINAVSITFTAGYVPDELLEDVRLALLITVGSRLADPVAAMPSDVVKMLSSHRRIAI